MEVYVEVVILDNFVIDAIIIFLTCKTVGLKPNKWLALLSILFGVLFALVIPFIVLPNTLLVPLKLLFGFFMVFVLKPNQNFKRMLLSTVWFLAYTFILGGLCFGLAFLLNQNLTINGLVISGNTIPISIFVLVIGIYMFLLYKSLQLLKKKYRIESNAYSIIIRHQQQLLHAEAFYDSGNQLYDEGQPVFIISPKIYIQLFHCSVPQSDLPSYLNNPHHLSVKSISGEQQLLVFTLEELDILHHDRYIKLFQVTTGVAQTNFNQNFDCLLHPDNVINP